MESQFPGLHVNGLRWNNMQVKADPYATLFRNVQQVATSGFGVQEAASDNAHHVRSLHMYCLFLNPSSVRTGDIQKIEMADGRDSAWLQWACRENSAMRAPSARSRAEAMTSTLGQKVTQILFSGWYVSLI